MENLNEFFGQPNIHMCACTVSVVQSLSCVWLFTTPRTAAHHGSLSFAISQSLLRLISIESVMPSNHLTLLPLLLCPQSSSASGSFQWVSSSHQVAKVLELQHQSFQRIFRVDFLLGLIGLISLQPRDSQKSSPHPNLKASILVQLSHLYIYWKNHSFDYVDPGW